MVEEGDRVRVQGLQGRAELNGRVGVALRFVSDRGRWEVRRFRRADVAYRYIV